jgi:hypothetical protein
VWTAVGVGGEVALGTGVAVGVRVRVAVRVGVAVGGGVCVGVRVRVGVGSGVKQLHTPRQVVAAASTQDGSQPLEQQNGSPWQTHDSQVELGQPPP